MPTPGPAIWFKERAGIAPTAAAVQKIRAPRTGLLFHGVDRISRRVRTCPTCGREGLPKDENAWAPFCSQRCKLIDLGKWLGEAYRVPVAPPPEDEQQPRDPTSHEENEEA